MPSARMEGDGRRGEDERELVFDDVFNEALSVQLSSSSSTLMGSAMFVDHERGMLSSSPSVRRRGSLVLRRIPRENSISEAMVTVAPSSVRGKIDASTNTDGVFIRDRTQPAFRHEQALYLDEEDNREAEDESESSGGRRRNAMKRGNTHRRREALREVEAEFELERLDVARSKGREVEASLSRLADGVSELMQWKDDLVAARALPMSALLPMTIACSKILRSRQEHASLSQQLMAKVEMLAPTVLLQEKKQLMAKLRVLADENDDLAGQEEARLAQVKMHVRERVRYKFAFLSAKLLFAEHGRVLNGRLRRMKGVNSELNSRLTRFTEGLRMRSKAGGARALTHDYLALLSPRTASPAVSDDEDDPRVKGAKIRARRSRSSTGHAGVSAPLPGKLGDPSVNRASTSQELSKRISDSVQSELKMVSFSAVVGAKPQEAELSRESDLLAFRPQPLQGRPGEQVDIQSEEWALLFDGHGTDPGCFGANLIPKEAKEEKLNSSDEDEDEETKRMKREVEVSDSLKSLLTEAAVPFINARAPGSRNGKAKHGGRYRRDRTIDGDGSIPQPNLAARPQTVAAVSAVSSEPPQILDSARDMPAPTVKHNVPPINFGALKGVPSAAPPVDIGQAGAEDSNNEKGDSSEPGKQPYRQTHYATADNLGSKYDAEMVPRNALLELKLKHSLEMRSLQRAFEERLQIVNSYWRDSYKATAQRSPGRPRTPGGPFDNGGPPELGSRLGSLVPSRTDSPEFGRSRSKPGSSASHFRPAPRLVQPFRPPSVGGNAVRPESTGGSFLFSDSEYAGQRVNSTESLQPPSSPELRPETAQLSESSPPATAQPPKTGQPPVPGMSPWSTSHTPRLSSPAWRGSLLRQAAPALPYGSGSQSPRPLPAGVIREQDFEDTAELLTPRYHAFVYPPQKTGVTYSDHMAELNDHQLRSHNIGNTVKPYSRRAPRRSSIISDAAPRSPDTPRTPAGFGSPRPSMIRSPNSNRGLR